MSRLIKTDYQLLVKYIESYSLSESLTKEYAGSLKPIHKAYLIFIALLGELVEANNNGQVAISKDGMAHLNECLSDVGESIFCWIHGAYKPSMLVARSSIENFVKAVICTNDPSILKKKSVYEIF